MSLYANSFATLSPLALARFARCAAMPALFFEWKNEKNFTPKPTVKQSQLN